MILNRYELPGSIEAWSRKKAWRGLFLRVGLPCGTGAEIVGHTKMSDMISVSQYTTVM